MHHNLFHMLIVLGIFLAANGLFMTWLFYHLKAKSRQPIPVAHYLKLCCFFAALSLVVYVGCKHSRIRCKDLDKATQCQCYALEVVHEVKDTQKRDNWAKRGLQACPDSAFFSKFLEGK